MQKKTCFRSVRECSSGKPGDDSRREGMREGGSLRFGAGWDQGGRCNLGGTEAEQCGVWDGASDVGVAGCAVWGGRGGAVREDLGRGSIRGSFLLTQTAGPSLGDVFKADSTCLSAKCDDEDAGEEQRCSGDSAETHSGARLSHLRVRLPLMYR